MSIKEQQKIYNEELKNLLIQRCQLKMAFVDLHSAEDKVDEISALVSESMIRVNKMAVSMAK